MTRSQWQAGRVVTCTLSATASAAGMLWLRQQGEAGRILALTIGLAASVGLAIWLVRRRSS